MSWNWDHLRFFLALADAETLVGAAKLLNVSHTTVLRRIKTFESELQTQLFEHTSTGYRLNDNGQSLYAEAVKMKFSIDQISQQIGGADRQIAGEVVITTTDTLAHAILPTMLHELADSHEGLRFSLKMVNLITDMDNHEADIAIRPCHEPPDQLIGRQVGFINFVACASQDYALRHALTGFPQQTREHRFIVLDDSYRDSPFHRWLATRLSPESYCTTASSFLCAAALCRQGMGITVLPDFLLEGQEQLVSLSTENAISNNKLWILSHIDARDKERVRIVRKHLQDQLLRKFGPL